MTHREPPHVTILHLSDMQFGRNHRFRAMDEQAMQDPDAILETLLTRLVDDLNVLKRSHSISIDVVLMSGDLTEWGLPTEFGQVRRFIAELAHKLELPYSRFVILPGNHDVNRKLCQSYFNECEGRELTPKPPYFRKWEPFVSLFREVYASQPNIQFTEEEPWSLFAFPEYRLVIAALNSTMAESHREEDHYGHVGERQLRWFAERLGEYRAQGYLVLGAVHHNAVRAAVADDENLHDAPELARWLGPQVHLLLHGHTHEGQLSHLPNGMPVLSTGSAAVVEQARPEETPNQYQILTLSSGRLWWARRQYHARGRRWIGDTAGSSDGNSWHHEIPLRTWEHQATPPSTSEQSAAEHDAIRQYRHHVRLTEGNCPVGEHALRGGLLPDPLPLSELFIPQTILRRLSAEERESRRESARNRLRTADNWDRLDHEQLLSSSHESYDSSALLGQFPFQWGLLLGGPGSGKTAFTRWLCTRLATEQVGVEKFIPVRIELRSFDTRYRGAIASGRRYGFLEYLDDHNQELGLALHGNVLRTLVTSKRVFWLFDGLDEVLEPSQRQLYVGLLIGHITNLGGRGIITSRPHGADHDAMMLQKAGVTLFDIADFDEGQIERYVSQWSTLVCRQSPAERERLRQRIMASLQNAPALRELCGSPLLLTLAVLLGDSSLPRYRHELYQRAIDLLAGQWEAGKRLHPQSETSPYNTLTLPERLGFLRSLAHHMGEKVDIRETDLRSFLQTYLQAEAGRDGDTARLTADQLLRGLEERNSVLGYVGGRSYRYQHRMFQDFLRADFVREQLERQRLRQEHISNLFQDQPEGAGLGEIHPLLAGVLGRSYPELVANALGSRAAPTYPVGGPWDLSLANCLLSCLAEVPVSSDGRLQPFLDCLQEWLMHVVGSAWQVPPAYGYFHYYLLRTEELSGLDSNGGGLLSFLRQFGPRWPRPAAWERWALVQPTDHYPMTLSWRCALAALPREARIRLARELLAKADSEFFREEIFLETLHGGEVRRAELTGPWPPVLTENRPIRLDSSGRSRAYRPWDRGEFDTLSETRHVILLNEERPANKTDEDLESTSRSSTTYSGPRLSEHLATALGRGELKPAMAAVGGIFAFSLRKPGANARTQLRLVAQKGGHSVVRLLAAELLGEEALDELLAMARRVRDPAVRARAAIASRNIELRQRMRLCSLVPPS